MDEVVVVDDRVEAVRVTNKSGRMEFQANVFVDASGDADLAYLAGASVAKGRDGDHQSQPMTMKFRMRGVDLGRVKQYMLEHPEDFYVKTPFAELDSIPLTGVSGFYSQWKKQVCRLIATRYYFYRTYRG